MHPAHSHPISMLTARQRQMPGGVVIVEMRGAVDLATEEMMRRALAGAAGVADLQLLICDMTHVSFVGCAGLNILLEIQATLTPRGAQMRVVAQSPIVVLLFDVTGLGGTLGLCASVPEAIHGPR